MSFNRIAAAGLGALLVWVGILSAQTANSARLEEEWDQQVNTLLKRFETEPLGKKLSPENVAAYKADVQNIKRRQAELKKIFENPNARFPGAPPEKLQQTAEYMISRYSHYQYIGGIEYSWEQGDFLADRKHVLNRTNDARGRHHDRKSCDQPVARMDRDPLGDHEKVLSIRRRPCL